MHGLGIENEVLVLASKAGDAARLTDANSGDTGLAMALPNSMVLTVATRLSQLKPPLPMQVTVDEVGRYCLELVTRRWRNRKLHEYVQDLLDAKCRLVEALNDVVLPQLLREASWREMGPQRPLKTLQGYFSAGRARLADDGVQVLFAEGNPSDDSPWEVLHAGSYHINVTLPHSKGVSRAAFRLMHLKAAMTLQWLEPLLVSVIGCPTPLAPLSNAKHSALSLRMQNDTFAMVLSADLAAGDVPSTRGNMGQFEPDFELSREYFARLHDQYTVELPLWMQMLVSPEFADKRTVAQRRAIWKRLRHGYMAFGYDFRRDPAKGDTFGFEFRVLDNFDSSALHDVIRGMIYAFDHGLAFFPDDLRDNRDYNAFHDAGANQFVFDAINTGWSTIATPQYLAALSRVFHTGFPRAPIGGWTAPAVLSHILDHLYTTHHGTGACSSKMLDASMYVEAPRVPNVNREAWEAAFATRFPDIAQHLLSGGKVKDLHERFPAVPRQAFETDARKLKEFARRKGSAQSGTPSAGPGVETRAGRRSATAHRPSSSQTR